MTDDIVDLDDLEEMRKEIREFPKKWEERGVFEKVDVRYQNGRRGVGYVLLPDWKKNLLKVLEEESV